MTEQEIEKKLIQFKSGLELFKSKLEEARQTISARDSQIEDIEKDKDVLINLNNKNQEKLRVLEKEKSSIFDEKEKITKDFTSLSLENKHLKEEIEKLKIDLEDANNESEEIANMYNDKNEYLAKQKNEIEEKDKEIEKLKNEIAELEEAAEINKQVEALDQLRDEVKKAKENSDELYNENGRLKAQIASMELSYQELDLSKAGLEDSLTKKLKAKEEEATALKLEIEKLKKEASSIISISEKEAGKKLKHYILGTTSVGVMGKFILVINKIFEKSIKEKDCYILTSIEEACKLLDINGIDTNTIKTRLMSIKSIEGKNIFVEKEGQLITSLSKDEIIKWISTIRD